MLKDAAFTTELKPWPEPCTLVVVDSKKRLRTISPTELRRPRVSAFDNSRTCQNRAVEQIESRETRRNIFFRSWRYRRECSVGCRAVGLIVLLRKSMVYRDAFTWSNDRFGTRTVHCPENRKHRRIEVVTNM